MKEMFGMMRFVFSRVRTLRSFFLFAGYFLSRAFERLAVRTPARKELFAETKDLDFFFSAGRSELSPYVEIYRDHTYEQDPAFEAKAGDTVVDVGGHIGFYAIRQARRAGAGGVVYTFEPNPESYGRLVKNAAANGIKNIHATNAAVTSRAGEVTLRIAEGSSEATTIMEKGTTYAYDREVAIPSVSLDRFTEERKLSSIDLLKVDTEGAEAEVLESGAVYALPRVRRAVIETHSRALKEEVQTRMRALGFLLIKEVRSGMNALGENTMLYFTRGA